MPGDQKEEALKKNERKKKNMSICESFSEECPNYYPSLYETILVSLQLKPLCIILIYSHVDPGQKAV